MRISVVIPCYNAARWVAEALRSVAEQSYSPHEIIVVDDGSTDDSLRAIESSGVEVRLLRTNRVNAAAARNAAIEVAEGDWIAFLDADDRWYPQHLERAVALLQGGTDVAYLSLMDLMDGEGRVTRARNPWPLREPTRGLSHRQCIEFWQIKRNFYSLITIVAGRQRLREIGGFDPQQVKAHDVEMWLRLIHGRTWAYDPVATALHATHRPGGITQSGWALSQYYVMRGFLKDRELYGDTPGFERILQRTARETTSAALLFGDRQDQRRIRELAGEHLRPLHRAIFTLLGGWPWLYRLAHRWRTALKATRLRLSRQRQRGWPAGAASQCATPPALFEATVVIVTKNRKDELRRAVASALQQSARIEVLVIDDGSADGTAEMIRSEFPSVRLERSGESRGYIVHRNRAAGLALSPVIVSIDDDAAFASTKTIEETLAEFDHPRIGAVAIPSIDVNKPGRPMFRPAPPESDSIWVADAYRGTAHAVRRDLFARLGGYKESFFHQGEEQEFCLRMLDAGYVTRVGAASAIHHFESPKRDRTRMFTYAARNKMLFTWYNVPMPYFLVHLPAGIMQSVLYGIRRGYAGATVRGTLLGIAAVFRELGRRQPVRGRIYRLSRRLRKRGPARLNDIEPQLPAPIDCPPLPESPIAKRRAAAARPV
jgi:glycosyltransferase involved in cell wall biosynthesis